MNDTLRVMFATALLVIGLTTLVSAQQATATDDEVAPLSVIDLQTLHCTNQVMLRFAPLREDFGESRRLQSCRVSTS